MEDNYEIQVLIETRDFDALANEERAIVLKEITRDEYNARHNLLVSVTSFFKETEAKLKPDAAIQRLVGDRMTAQKKAARTGPIQKILDFQLPVYIPGVATVLLLIAMVFFNTYQKNHLIDEATKAQAQIIYKTKTDTVEKEVPKYVNVPVIKYVERKVLVPAKTTLPEVSTSSADASNADLTQATGPLAFNAKQLAQQMNSIGKSNSDEEAFNKFVVVAP